MSTKVLMVSESDDEHVRLISHRMTERSLDWYWLPTDQLGQQDSSWSIPSQGEARSTWYDETIRVIWYRKRHLIPNLVADPVRSFLTQENEGLLSSILLQYDDCRWVSSLRSLASARPKINQLMVAKEKGFQIPDTLVTNDMAKLRDFYERHAQEVVVKPMQTQVVEQRGGSAVIGTRRLDREAIESATCMMPVCYAQERLMIDAELRIVVFGDRAFGFRMVPNVPVDDLKQLTLDQIDHTPYSLSCELQKQVCGLVAHFGLAFAACDFAIVRDRGLVFLEINPNGQWLWLQEVTEVNLQDPFIDFLCEPE